MRHGIEKSCGVDSYDIQPPIEQTTPHRFQILSLFPAYFSGPCNLSITGKAQKAGLISIDLVDIRHFSLSKHKKVDDRPFGGGPGMVLTPEPCIRAIRAVRRPKTKAIFLSPQGSLLTTAKCQELAGERDLLFLTGHYEGVDQRVIDQEIDEEISIGDYILPSGCAAALVLLEAIIRFIPGVLGNEEGPYSDSSFLADKSAFEGPQYTRPREYEGSSVPEILLSGHQKNIQKWREEQGRKKLRAVRPDLCGIKE
ncbi:MAG: tRNA (guanosine(37)-N1)-methyltransferase TrmD [Chlamydiota bacterium]